MAVLVTRISPQHAFINAFTSSKKIIVAKKLSDTYTPLHVRPLAFRVYPERQLQVYEPGVSWQF